MAKALESHRKHAAENPAGNRSAYVKKCLFNRAFHLYSLNRRQRDFEADAASRSLDATLKDTQGQRTSAPLVECLPDDRCLDMDEALELKIRREVVLDSLKCSPRLQAFTALYMDGLSQADLARYFNISHERARQMLSQAVKTARKQLGIDREGRPVYHKPRKQLLPL